MAVHRVAGSWCEGRRESAASVDVVPVNKMMTGVGDRKSARIRGAGGIYIGDIRLTKRMP